MVYSALLPVMRTTRLPVVDWTDAPADLNGLVPERQNLVSTCLPSHFKRSLPNESSIFLRNIGVPDINHHNSSLKIDFTSFNIVYTLALFYALGVFLKKWT